MAHITRSDRQISIIIGANIRAARKMRALSLKQLADELEISYQQLQKYESGRNRISATKLLMIAHSLGISISYFYRGSDLLDEQHKSSICPIEEIKDKHLRQQILQLVEAIKLTKN